LIDRAAEVSKPATIDPTPAPEAVDHPSQRTPHY